MRVPRMKKVLLTLSTLLIAGLAHGEQRFGRPVVKVAAPDKYKMVKLDDVDYPTLSNESFTVSCLVYRGTERYYVEVTITNNTAASVSLPMSFVNFDKPGYTLERGDTMAAAREAAAVSGARFIPTPPPYVPPTYTTTINATATSYGDQTNISGTATTTPDYSGQAGANVGNAIGNAIAAHRFYKAQRIEAAFSHFLAGHVQTDMDTPIQPKETRTIVATFEQAKPKKKPFDIRLNIGPDVFGFDFKE
jgi:hypothetical protein